MATTDASRSREATGQHRPLLKRHKKFVIIAADANLWQTKVCIASIIRIFCAYLLTRRVRRRVFAPQPGILMCVSFDNAHSS